MEKKRTLEQKAPTQAKKAKVEGETIIIEPVDEKSPQNKPRVLKVIPPKEPLHEIKPIKLVMKHPELKEKQSEKSPLKTPIDSPIISPAVVKKSPGIKSPVTSKSPQRSGSPPAFVKSGSPQKSPVKSKVPKSPVKASNVIKSPMEKEGSKSQVKATSPTKANSPIKGEAKSGEAKSSMQLDPIPKNVEQKKPEPDSDAIEKMLIKMEFVQPKEHILNLIKTAKQNPKSTIVVTDSRLQNTIHPNYNLYLGHVVYTGAQSRAAHFNRAVDLELFLCPAFTPKQHFATIQVRIPAEFLSYRGNIAVRKSALWGTEIYTDDSDVVAMIIHSGHYRPVDAPDPIQQNPDLGSVDQMELVKKEVEHKVCSSIKKENEILESVSPVIAQIDKVFIF
jgi:hypothetical protein